MARLLAYLIEIIVLLYILRNLLRAVFRLLGEPRSGAGPKRTVQGQMVRDPVCGMFVSTELSQRLKLGERTLHFCSRECLERYQKANA